jgi:hypothetical protein
VPTRQNRQDSRAQLGQALILGGVAALIGTPIVYRVRAASAHARARHSWFWPTPWMVVPLVIVLIGAFVMVAPDSFDLRRRLLRTRLFSNRRRPQ